ncbi:hypothetical protein FACS189498_4340 [Spirochaetia bacterium]|nr:hypothetical protein FACS189498_4340 [Spirochaetia bacterium]
MYLGGEKLKFLRMITGTAILVVLLFNNSFFLSAQTPSDNDTEIIADTSADTSGEVPASPRAGESTIFLGDPVAANPAAAQGPSSVFTIIRMLLVLALAAAAVYGVVFFIKKANRPPADKDPHLRILARAPLGGTSQAAVLAVGSKAWLVGISEGRVSLITEIEEKEALDAMLLTESERNAEANRVRFPDFGSLLRKVRGDISPSPPPSAESIRKRREKIRGL